MSRQLVFVHGRSQEKKNPDKLKREWLDALGKGLDKSGLELPIETKAVRFPYYGDALMDLVADVAPDLVAEIVVRGDGEDAERLAFVTDVLEEARQQAGITEADLRAEAGAEVVEKGPGNWEWVQGILRTIDKKFPKGAARALALVTVDVYDYLVDQSVKEVIDDGVAAAMTPGIETVVVGHSLGTVVIHSLLGDRGDSEGWLVPQFVTLGCPLGVSRIKRETRPPRFPSCVDAWLNAMDDRDTVALYPLTPEHFPVGDQAPRITNKTDVRNSTSNRHGIVGYLDDPVVARTIYDALTAP